MEMPHSANKSSPDHTLYGILEALVYARYNTTQVSFCSFLFVVISTPHRKGRFLNLRVEVSNFSVHLIILEMDNFGDLINAACNHFTIQSVGERNRSGQGIAIVVRAVF